MEKSLWYRYAKGASTIAWKAGAGLSAAALSLILTIINTTPDAIPNATFMDALSKCAGLLSYSLLFGGAAFAFGSGFTFFQRIETRYLSTVLSVGFAFTSSLLLTAAVQRLLKFYETF
ncbi:hypothetical protein ACQKKX_02330 [Neorhizobium sp. NPDC001467]|uniref:hypothetical protein n=1 Tax=Neorhizobium sp. NPDC001467 TaxID=3390595 RepID=UPI003D050126